MKQTASIEVSTFIAAPVSAVFRHFADPARFAAWFGMGSRIEPRRGGRIELAGPGPLASGPIEEWVENQRIVFRFGHPAGAGPLPPASTTVTVTFRSERQGTRVTVVHAGLPDETQRAGVGSGWLAAAARLDAALWRDRIGDRLPGLVDQWTAAWNQPDAVQRGALLAACFAERGVFCDQHSLIEGRQALQGWIGGVLAMMPGVQLERSGAPQLQHGYVTWPWRVRGPDGTAMATGVQFAELDAELRFCRSVGFWQMPG